MLTRRLMAVLTAVAVAGMLLVGGWSASAEHSASAQPASDPELVLRQFLDARARGDTAAALALFADDAIFITPGTCFPVACIGRPAIERELAFAAATGVSATITSSHVEGTAVTGRFQTTLPPLAALGLDRIVILYTFVVREGRIVLYSVFPDVTDPQTARFVAAQQAQPQPLPRALPNTGDGSCEDDPSTCE
jgi:SnoaL-like domain